MSADLEVLYREVMSTPVDFSAGLFIVRQWDGMDGCWTDCTEAVSAGEALVDWSKRTARGTQKISFREIDYYRIFPADTRMKWDGTEGHEMFRD